MGTPFMRVFIARRPLYRTPKYYNIKALSILITSVKNPIDHRPPDVIFGELVILHMFNDELSFVALKVVNTIDIPLVVERWLIMYST